MSVKSRSQVLHVILKNVTIFESVRHNRLGTWGIGMIQRNCTRYSCHWHKQSNISLCFVH